MPNAEVLAQGGKSASYLTTSRNEFEFYVSTGATDEQLMEKFHLDVDQLAQAKEWYDAENTFELDRLLQSVAPAPVAAEPVAELVEPEPEVAPEYGYVASPLHSYVFIKPLPPEHKGRLIVPKAYQSNSDMGFVHAVGPHVTALKPGDQVMFDKYAAEQERFVLLDEEGDQIELVKLVQENVTAILTRTKTRSYR
jgi:co-chaperonin GroES (HSP10)